MNGEILYSVPKDNDGKMEIIYIYDPWNKNRRYLGKKLGPTDIEGMSMLGTTPKALGKYVQEYIDATEDRKKNVGKPYKNDPDRVVTSDDVTYAKEKIFLGPDNYDYDSGTKNMLNISAINRANNDQNIKNLYDVIVSSSLAIGFISILEYDDRKRIVIAKGNTPCLEDNRSYYYEQRSNTFSFIYPKMQMLLACAYAYDDENKTDMLGKYSRLFDDIVEKSGIPPLIVDDSTYEAALRFFRWPASEAAGKPRWRIDPTPVIDALEKGCVSMWDFVSAQEILIQYTPSTDYSRLTEMRLRDF